MKSNSPLLNIKVISQLTAMASTLFLSLPANAVPGADSFQHNINATNTPHHLPGSAKMNMSDKPMIGAGAGAMFSPQTPILGWFEQVDKMVHDALPTPDETFVLSQNLNQELERVEELTTVYRNISKRYRALAKDLRAMPVQANWSGVQKYRDHKASFFEDEAECFEAMIKPRMPAQTIEDLRAELAQVNERAQGLKLEGQTLVAMDRNLRKTYSVHASRYNDPLYDYVHHKQDAVQK
ncbi:MAG: hypothetical protein P4L53_28710 [Candidatus Obscuribacterales bacterium]|nr:hypothetical protein [Candidatus Obscuribacterales bacterium]